MKRYLLFITLIFISCQDYYGRFVPLGDEFEDSWKRINVEFMIYQIEASKINRNEFFIGGEDNIYILQDSILKTLPISYPYKSTRVISSSFKSPQRLLLGTGNREIYYCSMDRIIRVISFPTLDYIQHLSFSPFDTSIFYLVSDSILLECAINGSNFDTIFSGVGKIINLSVKESGEIFVATSNFLFCSKNQGYQWDTLYISGAEPIIGFAIDKKQRLYISIQNRILISHDWTNWLELNNDRYNNLSIAGIEDGLLLVCSDESDVNAFKLYGDGKLYDISMGIVHNFSYISYLPILIVVNDNRYLISFSDNNGSILLSFLDTSLPP